MNIDKFFTWSNCIVFTLIVAGLLYAAYRVFIGGFAYIESESMEPTVMTGEWVYIDNATFGTMLPRRLSEIPLINYICVYPWVYRMDSLSDWGHHKLPAFRKPRRGDVIVFRSPESTGRLVMKRIVGLPGDTIEMRDGFLFINNCIAKRRHKIRYEHLSDQHKKTRFPEGKDWDTFNYGPYVVPSEKPVRYFVMGDNRPHSIDSRFWGLVEFDSIYGHLITPDDQIITGPQKNNNK